MSASTYSINNGSGMVWQFGNSRVVKGNKPTLYQTRKNQKAPWENAAYASGIKPLIAKVEAALKA